MMAVACGGNKKTEDVKDGKLTYTPQINEVTVVKLERKDFARQLLSNGKLVAGRKARCSSGQPENRGDKRPEW